MKEIYYLNDANLGEHYYLNLTCLSDMLNKLRSKYGDEYVDTGNVTIKRIIAEE